MTINNLFVRSIFISSALGMSLGLMSCSSLNSNEDVSETSDDVKEELAQKNDEYRHDHPINPCNGLVAHTHKYNLEETELHVHRVECEATKPVISNAHTHKARVDVGVRFYRHIHKNGANEHVHNEDYQPPQ